MQTWDEMKSTIRERFGPLPDEQLERHTTRALAALGKHIPEIDRKHLKLPKEAEKLLATADVEPSDVSVDEVSSALEMPMGQAREFVHALLLAIDSQQSGESQAHWRNNLNPDMIETFTRSTPTIEPGHRPQGESLADGAVGSKRPLATGQAIQPNSPVADHEPREGTKFSTGATTKERHGRTLAEGKPGSARPLSGDDDA